MTQDGEPRVISIRDQRFTILYPDLLRPLTHGERQALKNSIRKIGVSSPIVVDENNGVIDGANRLEIAAEIKLPLVPVYVKKGLPDDMKLDLALALNDARRHLTPADRRHAQANLEAERAARIARVTEARKEGESLRTIAEKEGVSLGQVQRDIDHATVSGDTVEPESGKVKGKDGKSRPATRSVKVKAEIKPEPTPEPEVDVAVDPDLERGLREILAVATRHGKFACVLDIIQAIRRVATREGVELN